MSTGKRTSRHSSPLSYLNAQAKHTMKRWGSFLCVQEEWENPGLYYDIQKRVDETWNIPELTYGKMIYTIYSW